MFYSVEDFQFVLLMHKEGQSYHKLTKFCHTRSQYVFQKLHGFCKNFRQQIVKRPFQKIFIILFAENILCEFFFSIPDSTVCDQKTRGTTIIRCWARNTEMARGTVCIRINNSMTYLVVSFTPAGAVSCDIAVVRPSCLECKALGGVCQEAALRLNGTILRKKRSMTELLRRMSKTKSGAVSHQAVKRRYCNIGWMRFSPFARRDCLIFFLRWWWCFSRRVAATKNEIGIPLTSLSLALVSRRHCVLCNVNGDFIENTLERNIGFLHTATM